MDIEAAGGADGGEDTFVVQLILECLKRGFVGGLQRGSGDGMESDQVDAALDAGQNSGEFLHVARGVVEPAEDDIFERDAALSTKVSFADHFDDVVQRVGDLHGHQLQALFGEGGVQADGQMRLAFVQKADKAGKNTDRRNRDATRAHGIAPVGGQDLNAFKHFIEVVERLSHAHVDDIGDLLPLRNAADLVDDFTGSELPLEPLFPCHAKQATHFTAHLRGDADSLPLLEGDHGRLDKVFVLGGEEIFFGSVGAGLHFGRLGEAEGVIFTQMLACLFRKVAHLVDR